MRYALAISVVLHLAILAWALISVGFHRDLSQEQTVSLEVALLTKSEFTSIRAGDKKAKPSAEAKPPKPADDGKKKKREAALAPAAVSTPPEPEKKEEAKKEEPKKDEAKKEPPKPEVKPEEDPIALALKKEEEERRKEEAKRKEAEKKEAEKKEAEKKAAEKKAADAKKADAKKAEEAKTKPKPKPKEEFDADEVAALLNKLPDAGEKSATKSTAKSEAKTKAAPLGQEDGKGSKLTASELAALTGQLTSRIGECWTLPSGAPNADELIPIVAFDLTREGYLDGAPQVLNSGPGPFFEIAARAAVNAIEACQPYHLPPEHYFDWQHNEIDFNPLKMMGG